MPRPSTVLASLLVLVSAACAPSEPASEPTTSARTERSTGEETPAPASPSDPTPTASGDPRHAAILDAHNARRAEHCAPPLAWSDDLARVAQGWADELASRGCAFEHNSTPYGENLAGGTAGTLSPEDVVAMWYREVEGYRFRTGRFSMDTGHFTQLVWRGTRSVGCGTTTCNGLDVWVCNYDPPGNVQGAFQENVLPTTCR